MVDFMKISTRLNRRGHIEIYPKFIITKSQDLMIRGSDFYAIWLEERGLWSTDEQDAVQLIDSELKRFTEENKDKFDKPYCTLYLWDAESKMIDSWHKYCQRQLRDNWHMLDDQLIFSNTKLTKKSYASKVLPYPLENGSYDSYDRLMSVLYSADERKKIEWAIGSIINGDSKKNQKFMVLYGAAGTGKSTVLNIIQELFDGYYCTFEAKSLGSANSAFALESFKTNPLVAIQHDGDLSRIEDNTRLNSLVSHEEMTVNEKHKSLYSQSFKSFLFMGTNKPVRITDAKSGLIRRLIDVSPTGDKVSGPEYKSLMGKIKFELGAIAYHCKEVYESNPDAYDNYIPVKMMGASNDFYNFISDSYFIFKKQDQVTLKQAWEMYKTYCSDANIPYPFSQRIFREELKNYFEEFHERGVDPDTGERVRSLYSGFKLDDFESGKQRVSEESPIDDWLTFAKRRSFFDKTHTTMPAQLAGDNEKPTKKWSEVETTLIEIDTSQLHYCKMPKQEVVIDFDIPDENGNKSLESNIKAAMTWPPTYAELSKSGQGIHLHYIWEGDVSQLEHEFAPHIEVKTFPGNASLRRKLTKCNNMPISSINTGLPIKKGEKVVNEKVISSEKGLRSLIARCMRKEIHPGTKPSIDFINKILSDAYDSGMSYDVSDLQNAVVAFATGSTHQSDYCLKLVSKMHFKSDDIKDNAESEGPIIFYDVEVFPNLFLVNYKTAGHVKCTRLINPTPAQIEGLIKYRLIGFNCRRYDNHIMYARLLGYNNEQLYRLSQNIISGKKNCFFSEAYNMSYTDVYDFCSKKQSLKKWEIELGIHHQELGLPWDQPVPEDLWVKVAEYCDNDVIATEAVFNARQADFTARKILADLAGMTVNDTTNSLTTRIIFGDNRHPQDQFNYRFMGCEERFFPNSGVYTKFDSKGRPLFPGYSFENGVSTYRGEEVGEGGYVYAEPGIHYNVALLDIASMHPSSIVAEQLFGPEYTKRFNDILQARIAIKHKDFDKAKKMLGGVLAKYLDDPDVAKDLAQALKIAINSVYGLTSATFDNPFRDSRNIDNIVAKRGALFMINLKHEVQNRGFTVAHIKTDSIKIPDATPEIIDSVTEYGKKYGYNFEHEATYEKMCLVNDAVYIAKYAGVDEPWTATGTQFQVPYVFKTLFSKEPIEFEDLCVTNSVSTSLYLDMNEPLPIMTEEEKAMKDLETKYKKGLVSDTTFEAEAKKLQKAIDKSHNYIFIGKVGSFCPIRPGCGGGELFREKDGKMYAVSGTKGWRWLESEMVKQLNKEDDIDMAYFQTMCQDAIDTISQYGDFGAFVGDEFMNAPQ